MVEPELGLTQMHPLSLSSIFLCHARLAAAAWSLLAHRADPPPPRAPLLETSTGLPGTVWEPSRRQSLDVDTIGGKGCKTSTVNFLAQSGQCTL